MNQYQEIEIRCECGETFIWTAGEQSFMAKLHEEGKVDKVNRPKRCPECRAKKKQRFDNEEKR